PARRHRLGQQYRVGHAGCARGGALIMEQMPYRQTQDTLEATPSVWSPEAISTDWRTGLPVLQGRGVTLRELRHSDAASLCALLTTEEVARFISPPPTTVEGFERFIAWTLRQRQAGTYICF